MAVSHVLAISVNVTLAAAPVQGQGYNVLVLLDEAAGNTLDGGARTQAFGSTTETAAAVTAGDITSAAKNAIDSAFAQRPQPSLVYAARVDTGAGAPETYADGYQAAIDAIGADAFYVVTADSRTAADQTSAFGAVETAGRHIFAFQSADADWLTSGLPAAFTAYDGKERAFAIYHDTATTFQDVAWAAKFLAVDPDERASPGTVPLKGVAALATGLTTGERANVLANNANVALPLGGESFFILNAYNGAGRPIHEILTADWLKLQIEQELGQKWASFGARNEKWTVTPRGAGVLAECLQAVAQRGINAGHFEPSQVEVTVNPPTAADANAGILRGSLRAQVGNTVVEFSISADLSRTPLAAA